MTVHKIVSDYENGRVTRLEAYFALAKLVSMENVGAIMEQLPPDWLEGFLEWARKIPLQGGVMIGSNLSREEARSTAEALRLAILAIRDWSSPARATDSADLPPRAPAVP